MNGLSQISPEQRQVLGEIVESVRDIETTISELQAARDGLLALASRFALSAAEESVGLDSSDLSLRTVAAELGAVQHVSDRTVQRRMSEAHWLVTRFPLVWQAQGAGRISAAHTRVILDAAEHLDDPDDRERYCGRVLPFAEAESPNRLRLIAARIAEQIQPRSIEERHQDACEKRGAWVADQPDGMSDMVIHGPSALVHGMHDRVTQMGKALRMAGDERTLAQLRFDLLAEMILTGTPTAHDGDLLDEVRAEVSVTVPVTTLMGRPDSPPAELDGACPIDADTARALAGAATGWDRVLTHPITGGLLAVDRYRPSKRMRRHLRARDGRCRFTTCGHAARECDLDHTVDAALGGTTDVENLGGFCRRHHVLKHHSPWHVKQLGAGKLGWTSPTGRTYVDEPPPQNTVVFTEDRAAPF
ncbi:HNH endonuclease [Microbacterium bovistercoris]|uniref:HNH endonuclease n=1 Tax=Microbacterium bovistercoris TaxID=2293570 RepID=A0A371NXT6_9MICO|nr:HNH endonuclease signature motif containing protein [Microbacterium bovistercoris]REJ07626.1 HNH endonuclease [Microbacterium bovistercoris]